MAELGFIRILHRWISTASVNTENVVLLLILKFKPSFENKKKSYIAFRMAEINSKLNVSYAYLYMTNFKCF